MKRFGIISIFASLAMLFSCSGLSEDLLSTSGTSDNASNGDEENTVSELAVPLTIEALSDGTVVVKKPKSGMQYSLNKGAKTAMTGEDTAIDVKTGDAVEPLGYPETQISGGTAQCKVYGNIMSLVDEENFEQAKELTENFAFKAFFSENGKLTDASGLLLPATTLSENCYNQLFYKCTNLAVAPKLPAEELKKGCYSAMFKECTALTAAPSLSAKDLAEGCYSNMFYECKSLTDAPSLPATELFSRCYDSMFENCTSLESAPKLPAKELKNSCYENMFDGCTKLNSITCLAENIGEDIFTRDWVRGVSSTGTFVRSAHTEIVNISGNSQWA